MPWSPKSMSYKDRILSKIRKSGECWEWTGELSRDGYGRIFYYQRKTGAARVAYIEFVGPIADGLQIDHLCRNRTCVNPAHLEPVTPRENTMRGLTRAAANAKKAYCPRGHPLSGDNLQISPNGGRQCVLCRRVQGRESMRRWAARNRVLAKPVAGA